MWNSSWKSWKQYSHLLVKKKFWKYKVKSSRQVFKSNSVVGFYISAFRYYFILSLANSKLYINSLTDAHRTTQFHQWLVPAYIQNHEPIPKSKRKILIFGYLVRSLEVVRFDRSSASICTLILQRKVQISLHISFQLFFFFFVSCPFRIWLCTISYYL